jgi:hypothetical protein
MVSWLNGLVPWSPLMSSRAALLIPILGSGASIFYQHIGSTRGHFIARYIKKSAPGNSIVMKSRKHFLRVDEDNWADMARIIFSGSNRPCEFYANMFSSWPNREEF